MADIYVSPTGNDTTGDGSSGNPYATPGKAASVKTTADDVYIKSGTYTLSTSTPNVAGGPVADAVGGATWNNVGGWYGYEVTPGDGGAPPVISAGAQTGITVFSASGSNGEVDNIKVDGNGGAGNIGFSITGTIVSLSRCIAVNCPSKGIYYHSDRGQIFLCLAEGNGVGFEIPINRLPNLVGCVARGNTSHGFQSDDGQHLAFCIAENNGGAGFYCGVNSPVYLNCVAHDNASDGFGGAGAFYGLLINCVATENGGYGFNTGSPSFALNQILNCAGRNNTSGNYAAVYTPRHPGFIALTADPFINAAAGDFALNDVAGGGALLRAAGIAGLFPGGLTTGYLDIGAAQHESPTPTQIAAAMWSHDDRTLTA